MRREPGGDGIGGAVSEQVDRATRLEIDEDRAVLNDN